MRQLAGLALPLALAAWPAAGFADVEAELGVASDVIWTDNVFGVSDEAPADSAFSLRTSPYAGLGDDAGALTWNLRYEPAYEYFLDQSALRGFDHDVVANVNWRITDRTSIDASESYQRFHSLTRFNEVTLSAGTPANLQTRRERIQANQTTLGLSQRWTDRAETRLVGSFGSWRPSERTREELALDFSFDDNLDAGQDHSEFYSAAIVQSYLLSPHMRVGAQLFARHHVFVDDLDDQDRSFDDELSGEEETDYYGLQLTWNQVLDRTLSFSLAGGPAWVRPGDRKYGSRLLPQIPMVNQLGQTQMEPLPPTANEPLFLMQASSCLKNSSQPALDVENISSTCTAVGAPAFLDVFPPFGITLYPIAAGLQPVSFEATIQPDDQVTFFAEASLTKEWSDTVHTEVSYERRDEQSSGIGTSSIADTVSVYGTWNASSKLSFDLRGVWEQREQSGETVGVGLLLQDRDFVSIGGLTIVAAETVGITTFTFDQKYESMALQVVGGAAYRWNERVTLSSHVLWSQQDTKVPFNAAQATSGGASISNRGEFVTSAHHMSVWLGIEYRFDPIQF